MKYVFVAIVASFLFSCSSFQTKEDFLKTLDTRFKKTVITVPHQSQQETLKIVHDFAQTCLGATSTSYMSGGYNTATGVSSSAQFKDSLVTTIENEKGIPTLYVKYKSESTNTVEAYIFMAKVLPGKNISTIAETYHYDSFLASYERFRDRFGEWIKREKNLCPGI